MRIYKDMLECVREQERNLVEMGIEIPNYSMQNKIVDGDKDFFTKEVRGECFIVKSADKAEEAIEYMNENYNSGLDISWTNAEFAERISEDFTNPGEAWKLRKEVWSQFLNSRNQMDYTYNERIMAQLKTILRELKDHPSSRQAIIQIHMNRYDLASLGGKKRIPCSMYYQFLLREGKLDVFYTMRSCDFATHFINDVVLAGMLRNHIVNEMNKDFELEGRPEVGIGNIVYFCGSLHVYYKDLKNKEVF